MPKESTVQWEKVDDEIANLDTDVEHKVVVKREAIPLVFVPGIMGSILRRAGTNGTGNGADGLPNLRWNPSSKLFMINNYSGESGLHRQRMLIGPDKYSSNFLEVHNSNHVGNGFQGVSNSSYGTFLDFIENPATWGPLSKIFDLPVYAVGYNWTDTSLNNGKMLAKRIDEIIKEAKQKTGKCEKVIVITHSMGGIVSRSASELAGAKSKIMGIIHGVQPATGSGAGYWRVKAGFEGLGMTSRVLGNSGSTVTPILGNMPGGLELLPNKNYRTNDGKREWLSVSEDGAKILSLPKLDPYKEIYRVQATGSEISHTDRKYWGLMDPDLLDPSNPPPSNPDDPNTIMGGARQTGWDKYLTVLGKAENFHNELGTKVHPTTYTFHGTGHKTADRVEMITESVWVEWDSYPKRGFRGRFKNKKGEDRRALLQDPAGTGDGTVPISSATSLDEQAQPSPTPLGTPGEHEPIYKTQAAQNFVIRAVSSLCKKLYEEKRGIKING